MTKYEIRAADGSILASGESPGVLPVALDELLRKAGQGGRVIGLRSAHRTTDTATYRGLLRTAAGVEEVTVAVSGAAASREFASPQHSAIRRRGSLGRSMRGGVEYR